MWQILLTWLALLDPHIQTTWWGSWEGLWSWISTGIEMILPSAKSLALNLSILQHESGYKIQDTSFSIIYSRKHIKKNVKKFDWQLHDRSVNFSFFLYTSYTVSWNGPRLPKFHHSHSLLSFPIKTTKQTMQLMHHRTPQRHQTK
jgi:hypothetical protein